MLRAVLLMAAAVAGLVLLRHPGEAATITTLKSPKLDVPTSVLSLTFESQVVANMIHSRHGKRLDCT
jgi:hypothetical protein